VRHVTLTDGELLLRPPVPGDAEALVGIARDPEISRWTSVPSPYRRIEADRWLGVDAPAGWRSGRAPVWLAFEAGAPDRPVACIGLHGLDLEQRTAEVGYWAAEHARGRGVTTDVLRTLCSWAFRELGLERIDWQAYVGNDASLPT